MGLHATSSGDEGLFAGNGNLVSSVVTQGTSSTASTADDLCNASEAEPDLKTAMQLLWAEKMSVDLKSINLGLQLEVKAVKVKFAELEASVQSRAALEAQIIEARNTYEQLLLNIQDKNTELAMRNSSLRDTDESEHIQIQQAQDLKSSYVELTGVNARLHTKLDAFQIKIDALVKDKKKDQELINQITPLNIGLNEKIEKLTDKIDTLSLERYQSQEQAKRITADNQDSRSKNTRLEAQTENLLTQLQTAIGDREWHKSEHLKLLEERNSKNAVRNNGSLTVYRLKGENKKLNQEKNTLKDNNWALKEHIAFYITQLDLAVARHKVFNCCHEYLSNIPDGSYKVRAKSPGMIVTEFHNRCVADEEYMQLYGEARQNILDHHRAHECIGQQKGDNSDAIRETLMFTDRKWRNSAITYD